MPALIPIPRFRLALCAAAAAGFALAAPGLPAQAQPYGYGHDYDSYDTGPSNDVTVTAEPRLGRDPYTGAPYERVETSRVVSYADLDLNARWGVRELRARVARAARDACDELEDSTAITVSDDPPCVATAIRRAMYQAPVPSYFDDGD